MQKKCKNVDNILVIKKLDLNSQLLKKDKCHHVLKLS